jgi:hypothetical protein
MRMRSPFATAISRVRYTSKRSACVSGKLKDLLTSKEDRHVAR